jgi:dynein heavy chain
VIITSTPELGTDFRIRVSNLTDCITYSVFMYTTRGLFECDKLIFTAQMAFQVSKLGRIL